jgi:outer membrane protein TolC
MKGPRDSRMARTFVRMLAAAALVAGTASGSPGSEPGENGPPPMQEAGPRVVGSGGTHVPVPLIVLETNGPVFSLEQLLEISLQRNPAIAASGSSAEASEARYKQERSGYYPQVDTTVQYHHYWMDMAPWASSMGANTFPESEDFPAATVTVSQYLYDFGKIPGKVNQRRHQLDASRKADLQTRAAIYLETQRAYYEVLKRSSLVSVQQDSVRVTTRHLERARDFLEAGVRPEIDVTKARVALARAEKYLVKARYAVLLSRIALENVLGGPPADGPYELARVQEIVPENVEMEGLLPKALDQRPELARFRAELAAAAAGTGAPGRGICPRSTRTPASTGRTRPSPGTSMRGSSASR